MLGWGGNSQCTHCLDVIEAGLSRDASTMKVRRLYTTAVVMFARAPGDGGVDEFGDRGKGVSKDVQENETTPRTMCRWG